MEGLPESQSGENQKSRQKVTKRVLITDKVHDLLISGLREIGYETDYDTSMDMNRLSGIIGDYDGMIINSKIRMDKAMIDRASRLKFIGRLGSGMEIIDVPYALSKGITPINSPEGNRDAVAEHVVGMLLNLFNKLCKSDREVRNFDWRREENRGMELRGKTLGIIGLGNTGSCLAKKLSSWELKIISYDKYRTDFGQELPFVQKVDLEDILNEADIITLHLPLSAETRKLVNDDFLQKCRKKPVLVNTSRGEIVDTQALINALQSGKISGACLDVFENEKTAAYSLEENRVYRQLFEHNNLIVSPHIAGWTTESLERIASVLLEKIKNVVC
ncbi:MAG: hypothetical protein IPN29_16875 [Saprospiraceae bacterium]|nr:hypothetical protein [Saprospiraceae bacterium]